MPALPRTHLLILIPSLLLTSWLGMMLIHESGHILAALLSAGHIQNLVFSPLAFSRTDINPNPHPLFVAWSGPLFGALFPITLTSLLRLAKIRSYTLDILAAFCLLANGAYIAFASIPNVADAKDLLRHGAPPFTLWLFGLPTLAAGLLLLHHLGPHLGLTTRPKPTDTLLAPILALALLLASLIISTLYSSPI